MTTRRTDRIWIALGIAGWALSGVSCTIDSAKNHYVLAEKLWTDQKYAASVTEFDKVVVKDPHGKLGLQALFRAAMTQSLFLSQYSDALRKFKSYTESSKDGSNVWDAETQIGEILYAKTEQYDQALQHYQALLKQRPDAPEAAEFMFRIAKSHFFLWQFDDAVQVYQDLQKRFPKTRLAEKSAFEIGVTYFTRGEQRPTGLSHGAEAYRDARTAFESFLAKYPRSDLTPLAQFGIASCLEETDDLDGAYDAYQALRTTYPSPNVIEIKLERIRERKAQRSR